MNKILSLLTSVVLPCLFFPFSFPSRLYLPGDDSRVLPFSTPEDRNGKYFLFLMSLITTLLNSCGKFSPIVVVAVVYFFPKLPTQVNVILSS